MFEPSTTLLPMPAAARLSGWLEHLGVSPLAFDDTISLINPLLSVHSLRARIVSRTSETGSATSFVLQAGSSFKAFQPGQFVMIGVTIKGVRHRRAYSPRAVEGHSHRFAITVQRQPSGLVSNHLNDMARRGDVIHIEQAQGIFTLPARLPDHILLIAGGSGITPSMAMLSHLRRHFPKSKATLIYFARSREDRIFAQSLDDMAAAWPSLQYVPIDSIANTPTDGSTTQTQPLLTADLLAKLLPNWADVPTYCCGPAPLMDAARMLWAQADATAHLSLEAFALAAPSGDPQARHAVRVTGTTSQHTFEASGNQTILLASEAAGMGMTHGCRQGICHQCTCTLRSGSVQDLSSGKRIDGEGQAIRVCVSVAMSALELDSLN
ncbi:MAG: iron-sulfur cluster-binding domain-containing protein [Aquabacterium sp.]|nr:iron-sulfur cluster-binding domain-containing protein [Aquabacterium sp.]